MTQTLPLTEVKAHLSDVVDQVENEHERIVVTRNGRPVAVLVSPNDLAAIEETLDLLSDPQALEEIRRARDEVQKGHVVGADTLREKYLGR